jgi:hypothetical protein
MTYLYHLGVHLKTGQLCRIPHPTFGAGIPSGFARVIKYREKHGTHISHYWTNPYEEDGELKAYYWSIFRWQDIQRQEGEKITGPNMLLLSYQFGLQA